MNLINVNKSELFFSGDFNTQTEDELSISISIGNRKDIKINNNVIKRLSELIGRINIILFAERDIDIIERSPDLRRKFIDILLSQIESCFVFSFFY